MSTLMESLMQQVAGQHAGEIASALGGVDKTQVNTAIAGAVPLLMGALAKNSRTTEGAGALLAALDRDHDGSVLDDLGSFLGGSGTGGGEAILGHVLGGRRSNAEAAISKMSGLDMRQATTLLSMLAPLVMGALAKQRRAAGSSFGVSDLAGMLDQERSRAESVDPGTMGIFSKLLDQDGDGDMSDDIARLGSSLLGSLLSGR